MISLIPRRTFSRPAIMAHRMPPTTPPINIAAISSGRGQPGKVSAIVPPTNAPM